MSAAEAFVQIDPEERACAWFWAERFGGEAFVCPACEEKGNSWQHRNPEIRDCAVCRPRVRLRASGLLRDPKLPRLTYMDSRDLLHHD